MRIGIDARLFGLENAGLGRYCMGLIENLVKLDKDNQYYIFLKEKYFNLLNFPPNWTKVKIDLKQYTAAEQTKLPKVLNELNLDLIHFLHFNVPVAYKGRFVVTIHDLIMHDFSSHETSTQPFLKFAIKRIGYKYVFGKAVNRACKIIVPSEFVRHQLKKHYPQSFTKTTVLYEGVTKIENSQVLRKRLPLKYDLDKPYFIYTGSAYPHKNLRRAIEAVVYLNESLGSESQLALVSSKNIFTQRLAKYIKEQKAEKYIKLLGFVPDQELDILYKCSVSFLYPSLYEGFGLPGLEAMSCGTICLASEIFVFKEVYQKSAIYFNPYDFTSIAETMKKVMQFTPQEREKYLKLGAQQVKKYSWEKMARQTLEVYNQIDRPISE